MSFFFTEPDNVVLKLYLEPKRLITCEIILRKKSKPKDNTFPDSKLWIYNKHNSMILAYNYNYV